MRTPRTPKLKRIDLRRANGHVHPDIRTDGTKYLVQIGGCLYSGPFTKQWYGLNFSGGPWQSGLQFDAPGTNRSRWQAAWEIRQ